MLQNTIPIGIKIENIAKDIISECHSDFVYQTLRNA
jgi:hypothetical protein